MKHNFSCRSSGRFLGATERLKRKSCFSVGNFSDGNSCSFTSFTSSRLFVAISLILARKMEPGRAAWERMKLVSNGTRFYPDENFRNFSVNGKRPSCSMAFQPDFPETFCIVVNNEGSSPYLGGKSLSI